MKIQHHPITLRLLTLLAAVLCAAGTVWGETTYKLVQVTSVEAGKLYVFEQTYNNVSYVMGRTISSDNCLNTFNSYKVNGLTGNEGYVWTLEAANNGFYMKNENRTYTGLYLNNTSSTDVSFGNKNSIWAFNFQEDNTVMIQNKSNNNRFLGFPYSSGTVTYAYKAYATGSHNESTYPHAIKVYQLVEEAPAPASVSLNASGYATFASTQPLDFSNAEANGYTAWQITGVNGTAITFSQITGAVAAGTGVLLKGTQEPVEVPYATTGEDIRSTNKLVGITEATPINENDYYGLKGQSFVKVNAGTVPAGKALLPASVVNGNGVKALMFVFDSVDGVRSIETVSAEEVTAIFNLAGQRQQKAQHGVNIINGRKVIIR